MTPDEAFAHVKHAYDGGRLGQAYIIEGAPRGEAGALAERILQLLFCEETDRPCLQCRGCRQVMERTVPDVLWIEPQKKSRIISIGQIRELQQRMLQTAYAAEWKACVLSGADRLSTEAANAFLKTLEEPPGQSIFLLLTDTPQFLLPTILSRCQRVNVLREAVRLDDAWVDRVRTILIDATGGEIGIQARADRLEAVLKEMKEAAEQQEYDLLETESVEETDDTIKARAAARYREMRAELMRFVMLWYRDILLVVTGAGDDVLFNRAHVAEMRERAKGVTYARAMARVRSIDEMNRRMEQNLREGLVFENGFRGV